MKLYTTTLGELAANCYILDCGDGNAAVIDIGNSPAKLLKLLEGYELTVKAILLTHGHFDHIGGVEAIRKATGAKVYIHAGDAEMLQSKEKNLAWHFSDAEFNAVSEFETVTDGQIIDVNGTQIQVLHTPGHTSGGVCYLTGNKLFSGDTLFHGSIGRLDLGGDREDMIASLRRLVRLEGDYEVYPGHMEASTLDWERKNNRYMRFLDE